MVNEINPPDKQKPKRSFFLTFISLIGFTYSAMFSILFLTGMIYSAGNSGILSQYLNLYELSRLYFFLFSIGGFLIFFASFTGIFLMWKLQWLGYYIYLAATLIFLGVELYFSGIYLPDLIIHACFILFFLLALSLNMRKEKKTKNPHKIFTK